ncbi:MAG: type IVB secretion system protein IcmH/DotU [Gammaproteobacteria bacterium]
MSKVDTFVNQLINLLTGMTKLPVIGDAVDPLLRTVMNWNFTRTQRRSDFADMKRDIEEFGDDVQQFSGAKGKNEEPHAVEDDSSDRTVIRPRGGARPADEDRTVVRPRPGARPSPSPASADAAAGGGAARARPRAPQARGRALAVRGAGLNPLVDAATELLVVVGQLRNTARHPDAGGLRRQLAQKMKEFDVGARNAGVANEVVLSARYSLCTLIDETVLTTPWGMESGWSSQSMLSEFHKETFGGEKFFQMLDRAIKEPARNLHLLEFMYLCMALGLEGKYRVLDRGRGQYEKIQDNLFRTIRQVRGDFERELSPHWRGIEDRRNRLTRSVPLWVVGAFTAALLLTAYFGFTYNLGKVSDPVYLALSRIGQDARLLAPAAPVKRTLTLREVLAQDIKAGLCDVNEQGRGSTVEIFSNGLFKSGSADVNPQIVPLLERIAKAMDAFPGKVLITGHTDNQPLGGASRLRYGTNFDLSQARAESVAKVLAAHLTDPGRLKAEGRGETEPKGPNDTPEQRAVNRRVEVTLLGSGEITIGAGGSAR